jgi:hypothetical protein
MSAVSTHVRERLRSPTAICAVARKTPTLVNFSGAYRSRSNGWRAVEGLMTAKKTEQEPGSACDALLAPVVAPVQLTKLGAHRGSACERWTVSA